MSTKERKLKEKENRREHILNAAEAIMSEDGLHGLSIELIAQYTQLAKGTIYLYFKSKEEILSILTIKARNKLYEGFESIFNQNTNAFDKIINIIKMNYQFYKDNLLYHDLISLYEANQKTLETAEMFETSAKITKLVFQIVDEAKTEGYIRKEINPMHLSMTMWGMTVGMLQLFKVRGTTLSETFAITEDELFNNYLDIFINGIKNS